jgi:ATP-dependent helicase HrpA
LERLPERPEADRRALDQVEQVQEDYRDVMDGLPPSRRDAEQVRDVAWLIQELRVSLFAPGIRTARPVSAKRIDKALDALVDVE